MWTDMPCVIYMHGNSSSRLEALESVPYLLPSNITLMCFDFAGCGLSEGEYISLGWWEREDLGIIIEYLRKERRVSTIGLWGRSMGAVTSLLYGDRDPSIAGMVLDSPFADMK
jgi:pimeloyl-ACP methyl ester carboxylesterase